MFRDLYKKVTCLAPNSERLALRHIIRGPEAREKRREAALKQILQDKQSEHHDTQ